MTFQDRCLFLPMNSKYIEKIAFDLKIFKPLVMEFKTIMFISNKKII